MPKSTLYQPTTHWRSHPGISTLEILIVLVLLAITSLFVYALFSAQIRLFLTQVLRIDVSSQNKIALTDITNQTRQAESISLDCPKPPLGPCDPQENTATGINSVVYRLPGLDSSGAPTDSFFDYLVYKQVGTNLVRIIYPSTSPASTRPATNDIIATDLAPTGGISFAYNNADPAQANQVTATVTTIKTESGKTQSITQSANATIRNQAPNPIGITMDNESKSYCSGPGPDSGGAGEPNNTWNYSVPDSQKLILASIILENDNESVTSFTYYGQPMTFLDSVANTSGVKIDIWYMKNPNPPGGTGTMEIHFSNSDMNAHCYVSTWFGVNLTNPFGATTKITGDGAWQSTITVASATEELVYDTFAFEWTSNIRINEGPGQTPMVNQDSQEALYFSHPGYGASSKPGETATNMQWTWENEQAGDWAHIGIPLKHIP